MLATPPIPIDLQSSLTFTVNGKQVTVTPSLSRRLSRVLRDDLGLTGTKVGCDAGDCGACTVLFDGEPVCACLVPAAQAEGHEITTVEGLADRPPLFDKLQKSFLQNGAAQCGACTPGMLVAATALLEKNGRPSEREAMDALGGVLCRCTGYRKIITAVCEASRDSSPAASPAQGCAVGARIVRLDGQRKVDGTEIYGADETPAEALTVRAIRCPHHRAKFEFGDLQEFVSSHPGIAAVFTAKDVPGQNCYGVIPKFADQPVFAETEARFRGEAVALIVGDEAAIENLDPGIFPVTWHELPPIKTIEDALSAGADLIHSDRPENILTGGRVVRGDVERALAAADFVVEDSYETGFVEHAYIEPEAGFARRVGDTIEVQACTQSPYMDRADIAKILGIAPEAVRIIPTAVGGGFGAKLDLSVQPFVALAAWHLNRPARMVYSRNESILSTTKRHPARMRLRAGASRDGKLLALDFTADFNTGAYSSWGPTVAARVPVHASGPYKIPHYRAITRAVHTHLVPAGAFRGFGVPQTAIAQEQVYDELADRCGIDRLEFRILNALEDDSPTVTGQVLGEGVGIRACFEALQPRWKAARAESSAFNASTKDSIRRGVGVAGMWYGCGNTSLPNPSTVRIGLKPDGRIALHQGAVDIGQGSNTIVTQICADAMQVPIAQFDLVSGDTAITPDCGKTSASRQTFVTGKAAAMAGEKLRAGILDLLHVQEPATLTLGQGCIKLKDARGDRALDLGTRNLDGLRVRSDRRSHLRSAHEAARRKRTRHPLRRLRLRRPPGRNRSGHRTRHRESSQNHRRSRRGSRHQSNLDRRPDRRRRRARPGQALMEEFFPGKGENLHDYLIPSAGDMPPVESILIEDPSPIGPFGAKGIGEQAVIPTAPAILNAIHDAIGVRIHRIPATPDRIRAAILAAAARRPLLCLTTQFAATPARCSATSSRATWAHAIATAIVTANSCASIRTWCSTALSNAAPRSFPFSAASRTGTATSSDRPQTFVTAIGAGTTYPDYKPAPFIISSEVEGVDMVTVVTEGIFSYCGVKVKIDTDRHLGPECNLVRAQGEPVGHVTTGEYGSQMLSLGGVRHLTGGSRQEGTVTCDTLLNLCNGKAVELTVDDGATVVVQAGKPPVIDNVREERMRVGCGSATIGMFAKQWFGKVDDVVVVDDHITGVLSEHQAGKLLGVRETGIKIKGRRSTPGRYFQVAEPGTAWGGTNIDDPLSILQPFKPKIAWPGLRLLMVSTTGEHYAYFELDGELKPVARDLPTELRESVARIKENCEPALCTVLFMGGAGGSLRAGVTENPVRLTNSVRQALTRVTCGGAPGLRLARWRNYFHGRRQPHARKRFRLRADSRPCSTNRIHAEAQGLRRPRRLHGSRAPAQFHRS